MTQSFPNRRSGNVAPFCLCSGNKSRSKKRNTNVYLSVDLIEQAKALDLNLSATLNRALEQAVKERQRECWLKENRAVLEALNGFVEEHGLFSDDPEFGVL